MPETAFEGALSNEVNVAGRKIPVWVFGAGALAAIAVVVVARLRGGSATGSQKAGSSPSGGLDVNAIYQALSKQGETLTGAFTGQIEQVKGAQAQQQQATKSQFEQITAAVGQSGTRTGALEARVATVESQVSDLRSKMKTSNAQQADTFKRVISTMGSVIYGLETRAGLPDPVQFGFGAQGAVIQTQSGAVLFRDTTNFGSVAL